MNRKAHVLFEGDLSDGPGMDAAWTESVCYLGANRWRLMVKGLSFDMKHIERKGTQSLIHWCLEQDSEDPESAACQSTDEGASPLDADDNEVTLSRRTARLLEIAKDENATFCVACLEGLKAGTWPPRKRVAVPRILSITGVTKRGIWLHMYRTAFRVETTRGPGYLERPDNSRFAKLVLQSESSMSQGMKVRIPKRLLPRIKELQPEFDALDAVRGP